MPHKLLLADDSVTIQRVIELTFADEDVDVIAVGDGREAIKRIEADPPDIVLADIGMPEKDGYEVAAFVKNSPKYSHIPVLLLTGAFEPIDEQRAQDVGCDGVLAKPFEPQMVITRVNELLAASPERLAPGPSVRSPGPPSVEPAPPRLNAPAFEPPALREAVPAFDMPLALPATHEPREPLALSATPGPSAVPPLSPLDAFLSAAPELDFASYGLGSGPTPPAAAETHAPAPEPALPNPEAPPAMATNPDATLAQTAVPEFESGRAAAVPDPDASDAREMLEPPSVRISRRTPIAIPGFGAPALPTPGTQAELDDYFDKLDAAFALLNQAAPPPTVRPAAVVPPLDHPATPLAWPAGSPAAPSYAPAAGVPPIAHGAEPARFEPSAGIAQAFSALLAEEHGQGLASPSPGSAPASALTPALIDDLVERVANRVLERMTDRAVREAVTDIVSRVAERLVREEIERVKSTIK